MFTFTKNRRYILIFAGAILIFIVLTAAFIHFKSFSNKPNVILITIDALRADHLSCYGYKRNTSPNIDRLATEGTVFLNCFATSSATIESSPGFITGRYLGIYDSNVSFDNILDEKFTTLAEYLKNFDYYTAAFFDNGHYRAGTGFEQGFDYYKDYTNIRGVAEAITNDILNFLTNYRDNKPFFIWVHFIDPHVPYEPREEFFRIFENDTVWEEEDSDFCLGKGHIVPAELQEDKYSLNYYIARYDAEILYTDFHIGRLLKNIEDNTFIILSADHGEFLGERNLYLMHGMNIYDEVLHVPLIIKDNRYFKGGKKIKEIVSSVDFVPTILSRINPAWYFFNKHKFDGRDLRRIIKGKDMRRKYIYSYYLRLRSIRDVNKNVKYILDESGKEELYFLPDEYNNLIEDDSFEITSIRVELRGNLMTWLEDYPIRSDINPRKITLNEETKEKLRSLGYLQ